MSLKLNKISVIQGTIELKTGLHIGGGDTEMHIGGTDNPVVKHPHTNEPYIPGSSLKGKIRSLLELKYGICGIGWRTFFIKSTK
jgi:CRISPR-associated protein Csm3